jgi:hypothetical protein
MGEMARILGITRSQAYTLRLRDYWPHARVGTEFIFFPQDCQAIVSKYNQT